MNVFQVKLHHIDSGNCLITFETVDANNKRYFNRFDSGGWYTVYPSGGYWESNSRVSDDVVFEIVDGKGNVLFTESNGGPKTFLTHKEQAKKVADEYKEQNSCLSTYEQWRDWMLGAKEACGNTDYNEHWLYTCSKLINREVLMKYQHLGLTFALTKDANEHTICNKQYTHVYVAQILENFDFQPCVAIVGYEFTENQ